MQENEIHANTQGGAGINGAPGGSSGGGGGFMGQGNANGMTNGAEGKLRSKTDSQIQSKEARHTV